SRRLQREARRFSEETRRHGRIPLELQRRRAERLGYSSDAVEWSSEPVDWRLFPLPQGAIEGQYHPEHVARGFRELEQAPSQDAVEGAISRLEHALGVPDEFVIFPAALPASRRLLDILADPTASPSSRWGAAAVLTTLLEPPHPDIHF